MKCRGQDAPGAPSLRGFCWIYHKFGCPTLGFSRVGFTKAHLPLFSLHRGGPSRFDFHSPDLSSRVITDAGCPTLGFSRVGFTKAHLPLFSLHRGGPSRFDFHSPDLSSRVITDAGCPTLGFSRVGFTKAHAVLF